MIAVREIRPSEFVPLSGNPTLTSLDGKVRAPLRTILHASWTPQERAAFGIYLVEPAVVPEGKVAVGEPRYERDASGAVKQVYDTEDAPEPAPNMLADLIARTEALEQRFKA